MYCHQSGWPARSFRTLSRLRCRANGCHPVGTSLFLFHRTSFTRSTMLLPVTAMPSNTNSTPSFLSALGSALSLSTNHLAFLHRGFCRRYRLLHDLQLPTPPLPFPLLLCVKFLFASPGRSPRSLLSVVARVYRDVLIAFISSSRLRMMFSKMHVGGFGPTGPPRPFSWCVRSNVAICGVPGEVANDRYLTRHTSSFLRQCSELHSVLS